MNLKITKFSGCHIGKLNEKFRYAISEYVKRSELCNPYGSNRDTWKWPYIIHNFAKSTKKQIPSFHSIQSRIIRQEDTPWAFFNQQDTRLENLIPTWDISLEELGEYYVRVYKARFIDWTNDRPTGREVGGNMCNQYKRRIPWLYSGDGK